MEYSRWNGAETDANGQYVIQPWWSPNSRKQLQLQGEELYGGQGVGGEGEGCQVDGGGGVSGGRGGGGTVDRGWCWTWILHMCDWALLGSSNHLSGDQGISLFLLK